MRQPSEENAKTQEDANDDNKKNIIMRFLLKFIYSLDLKIAHGLLKFMVLKDENFNISATNIRNFFNEKLDNQEFCKKYECFSVNVEGKQF